MSKKCYCCLLEKPLNEFYNKQTTCKECLKNNQNELYKCEICSMVIRKQCKKNHEYSDRHIRCKITGEHYEKGLQWQNMRRFEPIN